MIRCRLLRVPSVGQRGWQLRCAGYRHGLPLAAVSVLGGAAVPRASRYAAPWPVVAAALAGAIGLGAALAGVGDAPSGRLELPPR